MPEGSPRKGGSWPHPGLPTPLKFTYAPSNERFSHLIFPHPCHSLPPQPSYPRAARDFLLEPSNPPTTVKGSPDSAERDLQGPPRSGPHLPLQAGLTLPGGPRLLLCPSTSFPFVFLTFLFLHLACLAPISFLPSVFK